MFQSRACLSKPVAWPPARDAVVQTAWEQVISGEDHRQGMPAASLPQTFAPPFVRPVFQRLSKLNDVLPASGPAAIL